MKEKLKRVWLFFSLIFPFRVPTTPEEFESLVGHVATCSGVALNDDARHAVATLIMHLQTNNLYMPKMFFYKALQRSITNAVAFKELEAIKQRAKESVKVELTNPQTM